jgi:hypothetical protein
MIWLVIHLWDMVTEFRMLYHWLRIHLVCSFVFPSLVFERQCLSCLIARVAEERVFENRAHLFQRNSFVGARDEEVN